MQIAIIGLGLIGGSLAKALKENTEHTVIGFDRDENTLLDALSLGAIDSVGSTSLLENADVVYVCLYPADVVRFVEENAPHFKEGCIVTDVCGIKNQVCGKLTEIAKNYPFVYVGGHPMAGKEKGGFDNADAALFEGACYILTPTPSTPAAVVDGMKELAAQLGCARMTVTTPAHHDRMIAFTSQLPHVLAGAYVKSPCCLYHAGFSAGSYRDVSRVASVDETLWTQLFLLNQTALCAEIDGLMERLQACRDAVAAGDRQALTALLREGRERKEEADGALPPLPEHRKERTP